MTDTGALIRQWENSGSACGRVAARLAREIASGRVSRHGELPAISVLADEFGTSGRTVSAAKKLLCGAGILRLEARRYYVA